MRPAAPRIAQSDSTAHVDLSRQFAGLGDASANSPSASEPVLSEQASFEPPMAEFMTYALVPLAIAAVALVLLLGLFSIWLRGGSPQSVSEADAPARAAAIRRDRCHHVGHMGAGPLGPPPRTWSFSTGYIPARGDDGSTSLGTESPPQEIRSARRRYGTLDEVSAAIGLARVQTDGQRARCHAGTHAERPV